MRFSPLSWFKRTRLRRDFGDLVAVASLAEAIGDLLVLSSNGHGFLKRLVRPGKNSHRVVKPEESMR